MVVRHSEDFEAFNFNNWLAIDVDCGIKWGITWAAAFFSFFIEIGCRWSHSFVDSLLVRRCLFVRCLAAVWQIFGCSTWSDHLHISRNVYFRFWYFFFKSEGKNPVPFFKVIIGRKSGLLWNHSEILFFFSFRVKSADVISTLFILSDGITSFLTLTS